MSDYRCQSCGDMTYYSDLDDRMICRYCKEVPLDLLIEEP